MPVYEYNALNTKGKNLKGIIDADSIALARQKLRERALYPVELRETSAKVRPGGALSRSAGNLFRRVGLREVSVMTRQLATLLDAGLPLVPSLTVLISQTVNPQLKKTLAQVKEEVNEGNSLAQSISHYPGVFSPFFVNMVRAGEASGALNVVLKRLADFNESRQALQGRIRAALTYPIFMFIIGSLVVFFLTTFIVPQITEIFRDMNQTLPGITVFLITVSGILRSFWLLILLFMCAAIFSLHHLFTKTSRGRYLWDRIKLRTPFVGGLIHRMAIARFGRTLGTLLQSGVPLLNALAIVKNVVSNELIADVIQDAGKDVEEGQGLAATLSKSSLIPPLAVQMIAVGEQTGNLEEMLFRLSDSYEREVESNIMVITSLLEPVMILVMGLMVAFIVVSILLPIFEMNQLVR
ncbi:MAG: type II secretion system inner membrane protein GspF [Deltaproteobacteria bacterium]|nr:type II secretion system inner membrane protein GspF [Deltaproteobacteria bacterium]